MEFSQAELEAFLSKVDFDFSSPEGWESFLSERALGGAGRDADGIQLRDIKNYAVGTAMVTSSQETSDIAHFRIRSLGTGLALAPGIVYIYYPDSSWEFKVHQEYVGSPKASLDFYLNVGGGGTPTRPNWGALYYIVLTSGEIPGQGAAKTLGKQVLKESLKAGSWLFRNGFKLLMRGGSGYQVSVKVGASEWQNDLLLPQELLSADAEKPLQEIANNAWDVVTD